MKTQLLTLAVLLLGATSAFAGVTAHELDGNDLRIPVSNAGELAFRECQTCDYGRARIATDAVFELNGTTTSLDKIRQALATTADKGKAMIALFYDDESQRVTRIVVRIR